MKDRSGWVWMPHPGHLIVSLDCRFHLNTYVGKYLVSTVGEYLPDSQVREILAERAGIKLEGRGDERLRDFLVKHDYETIGHERKYETMVFRATREKGAGGHCCPWRQHSGFDLDSAGYNDPAEACAGHLKLCRKWANR